MNKVLSVLGLVIFVGAVLLASFGSLRVATLPEEDFIANSIIDDAIYYVVPARNLLDGRDYTFDGIHRTNGVQPLWALITVGICSFSSDRLTILRLMVILSASLWIVGSVLIYLWVRQISSGAALISLVGLLFTGFTNRMLLLGMENGLAVFLFAINLIFLTKTFCLKPKSRLRAFLLLGWLMAVFSLVRIEYFVFTAVVCGLLFLLVLYKKRDNLSTFPPLKWYELTICCLPAVLIFGSLVLFNNYYFDSPLPLSGYVKAFYESQWPPWQGGQWHNLLWQSKWLFSNAIGCIGLSMERFLWSQFSISVPAVSVIYPLLLALFGACGVMSLLGVSKRLSLVLRDGQKFGFLFSLLAAISFGIIHWLMASLFLPHFTLYGVWYFGVEMTVFWILIGLILIYSGRLLSLRFKSTVDQLIGLMVGIIILILNSTNYGLVAGVDFSNVNTFVKAAQWMENYLSACQRIGTLSSGYVSYYAPSHQVINLDGLMNDKHFFENYLKRGRLKDYVRDMEIGYLTDYASIETWKYGFFPHTDIPLSKLELVRMWPMGGDAYSKHYLYVVWRVLDRERKSSTPGDVDKISQLQFSALVLDKYKVVTAEELESALRSQRDLRVVSTVVFPKGPSCHILMNSMEYEALNLKPSDIIVDNRLDIDFGSFIRLLGVDANSWKVTRGGHFVLTRYWYVLNSPPPGKWRIDTYFNPSKPGWWWHVDVGCYGTWPITNWKPGDVIVETYRIAVPSDLKPGIYPVSIGIWSDTDGWLPPNSRNDETRPGMAFIHNIEVR